jgi:hypothetical protein
MSHVPVDHEELLRERRVAVARFEIRGQRVARRRRLAWWLDAKEDNAQL